MAVRGRCLDKVLRLSKISSDKVCVERIGESLEVNVHRVDIGKKLVQHGRLRGPVRHEHVEQACLMDQSCRVPHIFPGREHLVVGVGRADRLGMPRSCLLCEIEEFLRAHIPCSFAVSFLRYCKILAEGTGQVAPVASCRDNETSGVEHGEWLLLDRVEGKRRQIPVAVTDDLAVPADSRAAEAPLSL